MTGTVLLGSRGTLKPNACEKSPVPGCAAGVKEVATSVGRVAVPPTSSGTERDRRWSISYAKLWGKGEYDYRAYKQNRGGGEGGRKLY